MAKKTHSSQSAARVIDLRVARALRAMQQEPARNFRVRELARIAGASRATFARLFLAATGRSPIRYLTERRLERAATLLVTTPAPLAHIAEQVGYTSEFALSRAFKRLHGVPPSRYRAGGSTPIRCAA